MKRILIIFSFFLYFSLSLFAKGDFFKQANDYYAKGEYENAAKTYELIIANQGVAPELYYNLGNAYYKLGEISKSILNYERALRLNPNYDDARINNELAQQKIIDNIVQVPPFFIMRWFDLFIKFLSSNQWFILSVGLFLASMILILLFVFGNSVQFRKISFYFALILFAVSMTSLLFSGIRNKQLKTEKEAIIMSGILTVKSSPDKSGTDLFQLHEGTKVKIKSELGKWCEIKIGNGSIGWVENENIEKI